MKIKKTLLLIGFLSYTILYAQETTFIKNIRVDKKEAHLIVTYDIEDNNLNTFYEIHIRLYDSSSYAISTPSVSSGNIGEYIKPGKDKKIIIPFEPNKLNPNVSYGVLFYNINKYLVSEKNAVLRSILIPGWGDRYVFKNGKTTGLIITALTYGCIGYGIYNKVLAENEYTKYKDAFEQSEIDKRYDNAINKNNQFIIFTSAGIGIWAFDIVRVAIQSNKIKTRISNLSSGQLSTRKFNYCVLPPTNQSNSPVVYLSLKF